MKTVMYAFLSRILKDFGIRSQDSGVPEVYRDRRCQGASWRNRFPSASKWSIRDFLASFTSAFAINPRCGLRFSPHDGLMDIYRARYPSREVPDILEFETLDRDLRKTYGVGLAAFWHDHLTLGELFAKISGR